MVVIIVCFFLYGIACSMLYIVCNIYIGEVANPKNRELIGASYNFATAIGIQVDGGASSTTSYTDENTPFCVQKKFDINFRKIDLGRDTNR